MNAPHAFSLSLWLSLYLTHISIHIYMYIYTYITYLQLSIRVQSQLQGTRGEMSHRWQQQMQKHSPHDKHMRTSHTVQAYQKKNYSRHISTCEYAQLDDIIHIDIHITAIAQSNVYRSQNRTIILNVILTLILLDVVYYSVSFMCTKQPTTLHNNLKQRNRGGEVIYIT